jgi:PhnB protein
MATKLNPYLNFVNGAKAAMEYYKGVFGGELTMSTCGEGGMASDPSNEKKIMHSQLIADNGITLMASDMPSHMEPDMGSNISISLSGNDEKELRGYWDGLSAGGKIVMPLEKAPWGDTFGMCTDKFGIQWLVNISGQG